MSGSTQEPLEELIDLHREIDQAAAVLARTHGTRLRCTIGCASCCVDDLTVWPVEAERIRRSHPDLLRDGEPHAAGACAFLDERGACRIYADRPSVCRSQGLPLRILFEDEAGEIAERRDVCPLNLERGTALEALAEEDCWLVGPFELRLAAIEARFSVAPEAGGRRVALRELFETQSSAAPARPIRRERSRPTTPR